MRLLPTAVALLVAASMLASLPVRYITYPAEGPCGIAAAMDIAGIPFDTLGYNCWGEHVSGVRFRIAHCSDAILLHYVVTEDVTKASVIDDNGPVFRDACVEFFLSPSVNNHYYNFEMNCIGTLLLQGGHRGIGRQMADKRTLEQVERYTTLGTAPIDLNGDTITWEAAMIIPCSSLFLDSIKCLDGRTMTANFYKCGGRVPNHLSWRPIEAPRPQFHRPDCFDSIQFIEPEGF